MFFASVNNTDTEFSWYWTCLANQSDTKTYQILIYQIPNLADTKEDPPQSLSQAQLTMTGNPPSLLCVEIGDATSPPTPLSPYPSQMTRKYS